MLAESTPLIYSRLLEKPARPFVITVVIKVLEDFVAMAQRRAALARFLLSLCLCDKIVVYTRIKRTLCSLLVCVLTLTLLQLLLILLTLFDKQF